MFLRTPTCRSGGLKLSITLTAIVAFSFIHSKLYFRAFAIKQRVQFPLYSLFFISLFLSRIQNILLAILSLA